MAQAIATMFFWLEDKRPIFSLEKISPSQPQLN